MIQLLPLLSLSAAAATQAFWMPRKRHDVIVIGAGNGGLSAAVSAAEQGASVLVIEKAEAIGRNKHMDRGLFASSFDAYGNPTPGDSPEKHFRDSLEVGGEEADPALLRKLAFEAPGALKWLRLKGVLFSSEPINYFSHWPRCYRPVVHGYLDALHWEARRLDVDFMTDAEAQNFIEEKGRVVGVSVKTVAGMKEFYAKKGVVAASGGFGANRVLIGGLDEKLRGVASTNHPRAMGDMMLAAQNVGAALVNLDKIFCVPSPVGIARTQGMLHWEPGRFIFVNKNGERFVDEDARRAVLVEAFFKNRNNVFEIADSRTVLALSPSVRADLWKGLEYGSVFKAHSIKELARKIGVSPKRLDDTVKKYNGYVFAGKDPDFGKMNLNPEHVIGKAPFWAVNLSMKVHETLGGLKINERAQVLKENGKPVPGLYACGSIVGGIHGADRLGGNGMAASVVFGRTAGSEILKG